MGAHGTQERLVGQHVRAPGPHGARAADDHGGRQHLPPAAHAQPQRLQEDHGRDLAVALVDVLKGAVPAAAFGAVEHPAGLVAGIAAVLGHVTSPFLRGRGGRGVATAGWVLGIISIVYAALVLVYVVVLGIGVAVSGS